jgi:hypothetical protein
MLLAIDALSRSAFQPEGKMNEARHRRHNNQKKQQKGRLSPAFP